MLATLRVRNFVLMEQLELELEPGFNVLTGETGAGKSIVVGALSLVLGGRASAEQVRPGAAEAEVEALFDVRRSERLAAELERLGVGADGELVVRRVVGANGRSRAYLNGRLCTAGELAVLAPDLADVASQHESVALTDPSTHLGYLDRFALLLDKRAELARLVARAEETTRALHAAREAARTRADREAFVAFQLHAIDALGPKPGEIAELQDERGRLRHAGKLGEAARRAATRLEEGDDAIVDALGRMARELGGVVELDAALAAPLRTIEGARAELADAGRELARYAERSHADPERLTEVEDRLYRLEGLVRQHGPTLDDVIAARDRLAAELADLARAEDRVKALEAELASRLAEAGASARALSAARKKAADKLGKAISAEIVELGMGSARVVVDVAPLGGGDRTELVVDGARLSAEGIDRVEFLIAPNKGIEPRPLRKIASGGELSRALLGLKRSLAQAGPGGLYVFDEVDAGVGGAVADRIGRAMADVARHHQVLCITHLAPIAAFADAHFVVTKDDAGAIVQSRVARLGARDRVAEVARMLSGAKVTQASLKTASELLRTARPAVD